MTKLAVILPTHNRASYLDKALENLSKCSGFEEIIVVNDSSTDDTEIVVKKWSPHFKMKYLVNAKRLGTPCSFNKAVAHSSSDLVFFTADDLVFPDNNFFVRVKRRFNREEIGIVGCKVVGNPKPIPREPSIRRFRAWKDSKIPAFLTNLKKLEGSTSGFVNVKRAYVTGAMAVRRSLCNRVKFNLDYEGNCNYEEQDFQKKVHDLGYMIFYDSSLIIEHKEAASGGHRQLAEREYAYWHFRNRTIYLLKHSKWRLLFFPLLHILRNKFFRLYPKTFLTACLHGFKVGISRGREIA